jgi:hypothetical protein
VLVGMAQLLVHSNELVKRRRWSRCIGEVRAGLGEWRGRPG